MGIYINGNYPDRIYVNGVPVPEVYQNGELIFPKKIFTSTNAVIGSFGNSRITANFYSDLGLQVLTSSDLDSSSDDVENSASVKGCIYKITVSGNCNTVNYLTDFSWTAYSMYITNTGTYPIMMYFRQAAPMYLRILSVSGPFLIWVKKGIPGLDEFRNNLYESCQRFNLYKEAGTETAYDSEGYYYRWN